MADISKCKNQSCTLKETCYRFTAKANEFRQSYADFSQDENGNCDYYWEEYLKKKEDDNFSDK